jgi:hypothetical protein
MRLANLFFKAGALEEATAAYKARIAKIDAKSAVQAAELIVRKEQNKLTFKERIAKATEERNAKIAESARTGKVVL